MFARSSSSSSGEMKLRTTVIDGAGVVDSGGGSGGVEEKAGHGSAGGGVIVDLNFSALARRIRANASGGIALWLGLHQGVIFWLYYIQLNHRSLLLTGPDWESQIGPDIKQCTATTSCLIA